MEGKLFLAKLSYFFSETVDSISNWSFKNRISFWNCYNCLCCPRTLTNTKLDFRQGTNYTLYHLPEDVSDSTGQNFPLDQLAGLQYSRPILTNINPH